MCMKKYIIKQYLQQHKHIYQLMKYILKLEFKKQIPKVQSLTKTEIKIAACILHKKIKGLIRISLNVILI